MQVLLIAAEERMAAEQAAECGDGDLEQRQPENQQGNSQRDHHRPFLGADNGERSQDQAGGETARVSKVDARRVEIMGQETEHGPGHSGGHGSYEDIASHRRQQEKRNTGEKAGTSGQAVQTINQVEGIGHGHQPKNSERQAEPPERKGLVREGIGKQLNAETA